MCRDTNTHREMYICTPMMASNPYYHYNHFMGTVDWAVFWWSSLVSWWWHCKLGSVKEIFLQIERSGKRGWENEAPRQSSVGRVILWVSTAQELRRSVLSDCVTLANLHYTCAVAPLWSKGNTSVPTERMNSLVLVRCLQTKSVISTIKKTPTNPTTVLSIQKMAAEVTLKEYGMTQLENYISMLVP